MPQELTTQANAQSWHAAIINKEAQEAAQIVANSGLVPVLFVGKPNMVLIAAAMGQRLGLDLFASLNAICVINGRPTIWGDAMLGIVRMHGDFEDIEETSTGEKVSFEATCTVKRKGKSPTIRKFSMVDAVMSGLDRKAGPWTQYPKRMCALRARSWALRDAFGDALCGFHAAEELRDADAEVTGTEVGGQDMSQTAPAAKQRGRPPGSGKVVDVQVEAKESPAVKTEETKPAPEQVASSPIEALAKVADVPGQTVLPVATPAEAIAQVYSLQAAKDIMTGLFKDEAVGRPVIAKVHTAMGIKKTNELGGMSDSDVKIRQYIDMLQSEYAKAKGGI